MNHSKFVKTLATLLVISLTANAQQSDSSVPQDTKQPALLTGTIFNPDRAVIVGANVVVSRGNKVFEMVTNEEGMYKVELPEGSYIIEVAAAGFLTPKRIIRRITAGANYVDVTLRPSGEPICILTVETPMAKKRKGRRSRRNR